MTITCDNAAFDNNPYVELTRIMRQLADDMEKFGLTDTRLSDLNGNIVGSAQFTGRDKLWKPSNK